MSEHSAEKDALVGALAEHQYSGEVLTVFGEAWTVCACGERIDLPVRDGKLAPADVRRSLAQHQATRVIPPVKGNSR